MLEVTPQVTGTLETEEITSVNWIPLGNGDWKIAVTATIKEGGNIISVTKEFTAGIPQGAKDYQNNTLIPLAKAGMTNAVGG